MAEPWQRLREAEDIVRELMKGEFRYLERAHIVCFRNPEVMRAKNKLLWAKASKASPIERALFAPDVIDYKIVYCGPVWDKLTSEKEALTDHELRHFGGFDIEAEQWTMVAHDVDEFVANLRKYGAWRPELEELVTVCKGLRLTQESLFNDGLHATAEVLRPEPGTGIDSVTLSSGGRSTTLHADGRTETT